MNKRPVIRFKGYTDDWEQYKLNDVGTIKTGTTPSPTHDEFYSSDGIPWVTPTDIVEKTISNTQRKLSVLGEQVGRVVPANTILVTCIASIGKNALLPVKGSFNQQINSLTPNIGFFPYFLLAESELWSAQMKKWASSGTMQIVNRTQFSEISTLIPSFDEQEQIGLSFRQIDDLIRFYHHKCDKLLTYKKAMLEKMFPKEGADVPEVRFSGFLRRWEYQEASSLFTEVIEKGYPDLPVLSATQDRGMVFRDETGKQIYHNKENEVGYKRVVPGQFVIHLRSFQGGFAHSAFEGITSPAYTVFSFQNSEQHDSYFWKYIFSSEAFIKRLETVTYGIRDGRSISYNEFLTLKFRFPEKREQQRIAEYFCKIDELIESNSQRLQKLTALKKALLDKMFV